MTGLKGALSFPLSRLSTVDLELSEGQFILELIPAGVEALEPVSYRPSDFYWPS